MAKKAENAKNETVEAIEQAVEGATDTKVVPSVLELQNKFVLVNVGTELHPADDQDIENIREKMEELFKDNGINCVLFVTHHAVKMEIVK